MKKIFFKDKKHIALWVGFFAFLLSLMWMTYSLIKTFFCQEATFEFEPIVVFFVSLATYMSSENPWDYKKYHFISSEKKNLQIDFSKNNGKVQIGRNTYLFDIKFSSSGLGSVQVYGMGYESQNIEGLCILKNIDDIEDITDFDNYELSKYVTAYTGDVVLLKNSFNHYAALRILSASARSHGEEDKVQLDYWILNK